MRIQIGEYMIRDFNKNDAASVAKYADNRNIWKNLRDAFPHPYSLKDAEAFLEMVASAEPRTVFAIATDTEAVGSIGLLPGKDVHRFTAELGYWLAEPFWGRGIVTAAVKALTAFGFSDLGLTRIFAEPYATNAASARVLEKAGFRFEGRIRAGAFKDGRVLDQLLYSRLRDDV